MPDHTAIIKAIDELITRQGKEFVTPPDANEMLERKGLLTDSKDRPGLPLRRLLRAGMIPHAYKVGRLWMIPRSVK